MDEELKKKIRDLEKKVSAIEDFLEEFTVFQRLPDYSNDDNLDELYDQAVWVTIRHEKASSAMLQRHLQIGYNRAARLLEQLEANGIVGPANGAQPRDVLVTPQDLEDLKEKLEEKQKPKKKNSN